MSILCYHKAMAKHDNFLADEIRPKKPRPTITYMDGFRFGLGATIAVLLVVLTIGLVSWGIIAALNIH